MRRCVLGLAVAAAATAPGALAWAAFSAGDEASASFGAYAVPAPANVRCSGLLQLSTSTIVWDAVAPPSGETVDYVVTPPGRSAVTTSETSFQLPAISLLAGQYAIQARLSSGWLSQPSTITVTLTALGLLYLCSTP